MKDLKQFIKTTIREFLNENKNNIKDYYNSTNIILVGKKTNLLSDMKERYEYDINGDEIYFFDDGYHFGTLYKEGRFLELRHDGSINEYGWRNF
jgi:hypothetical protein